MRRRNLSLLWAACVCLWLAGTTRPAHGVVISTADDTPNVIAPAANPGWANVGRVANGSAVYLGNRWVITANHVGQGDLRLSDGRVMAASVGSGMRLTNSGVSLFGSPDLRMFRLAEDPGLPALSIVGSAPSMGSDVMMIGAGKDRSDLTTGYRTTSSASGFTWTEVPVWNASILGYKLLDSSTMRWGMNRVSHASGFDFMDTTQAFATTFDYGSGVFEAQATPGDSGGGVFYHTGGSWELAGLMFSTQSLTNQPANTVVYGDRTSIVDLAAYRQQILDVLNRVEPLWQNQVNHYDVLSGDGVTRRDALSLVNEILRNGEHPLASTPGAGQPYYDVNGDYMISRLDLQAVVNEILRNAVASPLAEPLLIPSADPLFVSHLVPEPASGALALLAAVLLGVWAARRHRS